MGLYLVLRGMGGGGGALVLIAHSAIQLTYKRLLFCFKRSRAGYLDEALTLGDVEIM